MNAPPVSRPASGRRPSLTRQLLLWSLGALAIVWAVSYTHLTLPTTPYV